MSRRIGGAVAVHRRRARRPHLLLVRIVGLVALGRRATHDRRRHPPGRPGRRPEPGAHRRRRRVRRSGRGPRPRRGRLRASTSTSPPAPPPPTPPTGPSRPTAGSRSGRGRDRRLPHAGPGATTVRPGRLRRHGRGRVAQRERRGRRRPGLSRSSADELDALSGAAWVGVSAQLIGVEGGDGGGHRPACRTTLIGKGLVNIDPARYGSLDHPGDAFSYDIYTQVARALRGDGGDGRPLGGLTRADPRHRRIPVGVRPHHLRRRGAARHRGLRRLPAPQPWRLLVPARRRRARAADIAGSIFEPARRRSAPTSTSRC